MFRQRIMVPRFQARVFQTRSLTVAAVLPPGLRRGGERARGGTGAGVADVETVFVSGEDADRGAGYRVSARESVLTAQSTTKNPFAYTRSVRTFNQDYTYTTVRVQLL